MTKMVSRNVTQNQLINPATHKILFMLFKRSTISTTSNSQISIQNHHRCPKRVLVKKSIQMVNHASKTISIVFPLWEISFVRSHQYFQYFLSFWTQNDPFLRYECFPIVQRGNVIFSLFFLIEQYLFISRLCSLCGR